MHASHAQQLASCPLRERYQEIRRTTLDLTKPFSAEDQMLQSMPDASPAKWHLAHTTWFFETFILSPHVASYRPFDSRYQYLFNSYYKQLGSHPYRGARGLMSRPSLNEIHAYRSHVDDAMLRHLESVNEQTAALIELGLNHEQQHQELILTDIKHALWSMPLRPERVNQPRAVSTSAPLQWMYFKGGIHKIGHAGTGFAFDNEGPRHEVLLRVFRIASRLVTNAEYLQFMNEGGYRRPELWLSDGWDTVCVQGWNSPEWTSSPYMAYPGFEPAKGLIGEYNGKFMCNQFVLRGGSCATPSSHIRASYRNFFPPHARWQFMGIRLAK